MVSINHRLQNAKATTWNASLQSPTEATRFATNTNCLLSSPLKTTALIAAACGGRWCLPSPPMCLAWYCPQISLWWRTDAGDQGVRGEEERGLLSHYILAFCRWQTWCGQSVQLPAVGDWKRRLKLSVVMHWIKTQLQFIRFTPVLTTYVCCNANHSSIRLIHHTLQTDGRSPSNMNTGYHVFFFMTPKDSLLLLFSPESTRYSERHLLGFSFANLPPFLFLLAPLHAVTCSSTALLPLSLSRPNVLVMSTDRYFNTGHLAPEIHAPLHIHCCPHCKNIDYIFLMLIIPVKVNKTHSGVHVFQGPCPQGWLMWPKDWRAVPLQGCRWISSDVSQNSSRDLCTGNWIPLRVNNVYILAMCYPFTTEFPPPGIYSLCSDRCCHFDSTVWISLEVWLHPINTSDWQRSHHVCQGTGFINGGERRPLNLLPEPMSTTVTKKALKNDYSVFTL